MTQIPRSYIQLSRQKIRAFVGMNSLARWPRHTRPVSRTRPGPRQPLSRGMPAMAPTPDVRLGKIPRPSLNPDLQRVFEEFTDGWRRRVAQLDARSEVR